MANRLCHSPQRRGRALISRYLAIEPTASICCLSLFGCVLDGVWHTHREHCSNDSCHCFFFSLSLSLSLSLAFSRCVCACVHRTLCSIGQLFVHSPRETCFHGVPLQILLEAERNRKASMPASTPASKPAAARSVTPRSTSGAALVDTTIVHPVTPLPVSTSHAVRVSSSLQVSHIHCTADMIVRPQRYWTLS